MGRALKVVIGAFAGFGAGAALGWFCVQLFSSNTHDKSIEAVMTAAFLAGPLGAVLGLAAAWIATRSARN